MAGEVIRHMAEWLIVAFVLFALFVEVILHKLEHWIGHRHPQMQSVLRNLYREIMILGAVSFGFILYIFIAEPNDDIKFTFEVAHIFIFLFAVFHTISVMVSVYVSLRLSAKWKILERMELAKYLEKKDAYRKLTERMHRKSSFWWRYFGWWLPNPSRLFKYWKLHEVMTFHDTRFQFIYYRNLDPCFHFASFLRKIKSATFIELVEIHWTHFLFFMVIVLLDIARGSLNFSRHFEPIFLMGESLFNMILVAVLGSKIRRVYWKMTKNPATYYDEVDRKMVEEEAKIAEEELRIEKERAGSSMRGSRRSTDADSGKGKVHVGGLSSHQPIYANMTHAAGGHGAVVARPAEQDLEAVMARHSLDIRRDDARVSADRSSSTDMRPGLYEPGRVSSVTALDVPATRTSVDSRRSAELAMTLPTEELAKRTLHSKSIVVRGRKLDEYVDLETLPRTPADAAGSPQLAEDLDRMERIMSDRSRRRQEALRRIRKRHMPTASIAKNARDLEAAQSASPSHRYPAWVLWFAPRLGRVASPAEKLFWFGSHRFYFWCVEWVLFFATINLSATLAILGFAIKEKISIRKYAAKAAKAAKEAAATSAAGTVRAVAASAAKSGPKEPKNSLVLLYIALAVAVVALVFVLTRIAGIMKKYIFVLNNANLLPESMTIQAIHKIGLKNLLNKDAYGEVTEDRREYDTDSEEPESVQMRRNLSSFLGTEAQKGYMPGVATSPDVALAPITEQSPLFA